jgi:hypothetical protein
MTAPFSINSAVSMRGGHWRVYATGGSLHFLPPGAATPCRPLHVELSLTNDWAIALDLRDAVVVEVAGPAPPEEECNRQGREHQRGEDHGGLSAGRNGA